MRINRLLPDNHAPFLKPPGVPFGFPPAVSPARHTTLEGDFTTTARLILELALELDAIEKDRHKGRWNSPDLVDRCLKVWFAIKKIDKMLDSSGPDT